MVALLAALVSTGWLRCRELPDTQIFRCDEGYYVLQARRLLGQVRAACELAKILSSAPVKGLMKLPGPEHEKIEALTREGYGMLGGRFGHDALLALAMLCTGPAGEDWAGNAVGALFGTLCLVLVAVWAGWLFGLPAALFAVVLLGSSAMHLAYSRSSLAETDLAFFAGLTLFLYSVSLEGKRPRLFATLAGLAFGTAFVVNLRVVPVVYALVVCELVARRGRLALECLALFGCAALPPLIAAELFYYALFLASGVSGVLLTRQTFVMDIGWLFLRLNGGVMNPGLASPGAYPRYLAAMETPAFLAIGLAGFAMAAIGLWRGRRVGELDRSAFGAHLDGAGGAGGSPAAGELPVVLAAVVLGLYYQFAVGLKSARYLSTAPPLFAVLGACALAKLHRWLARERAGGAGALLAIALAGAVLAAGVPVALARQPSGPSYREVRDWLRARGATKLVATQVNVFRVWWEGDACALVATLDELRARHAAGHRWYVTCYQKYEWTAQISQAEIDRFLERTPPVMTFQHPRGAGPHAIFENATPELPVDLLEDMARIRVWDLDVVFARP